MSSYTFFYGGTVFKFRNSPSLKIFSRCYYFLSIRQNTDKSFSYTSLKCGPSFKIFHRCVFVVFVVFHGLVIYAFFSCTYIKTSFFLT